jgi:hypothetical protein
LLKNTFYPAVFIPIALLEFALLVVTPALAVTSTVNSIADDGTGTCAVSKCTLRDAISSAVSGDTIIFSLPAKSTIDLTSGELLINKNLTINGLSANRLTVQRSAAPGTPNFRIFTIYGDFNVTISGLTIANGAVSGSMTGGGIYNGYAKLTITNSTISGNSADEGGGIYTFGDLPATGTDITNSTISGNTADTLGGGIYGSGVGSTTITNSTISGNSAGGGGGVYNNGFGHTVYARNSIVALNTSSYGPDVSGGLVSQGFNFIGNNSGALITPNTGDQIGTAALPFDPMLGPLQDNGGPTKTHALLLSSPAIERGHSSGSDTDQRGFARPVDSPVIGNAGGGDGSDIGAYEVQADQLPGCNSINRIVNNNNDSGTDSLRDVIANVCAGSTITFAANVRGAINLTSGELLIGKWLTINGPGANLLSVQRSAAPGTPNFRIFDILANVNATISGLTIANGNVFPASGGGIRSYGTLTLTNATISANAALNGGGLWNDFGTVTVTNSTISGNTVSDSTYAGSGGGIFNHGGTVNITNSTLSGNAAIGPGGNSDSGGGILTNVGTVSITNSTISGNTADFGGGIRNVNGGVVSSRNTIIALNTSANGPDVNGPLTSQDFNLIGNASGATISPAQLSDQIGVTPPQLNLGPLQENGGPTPTHALLSGSFAIDKGHSSGSTSDQCGFTRPVDNPAIPNATGGDGSDIGAFEYAAIVPRLYLPLILG